MSFLGHPMRWFTYAAILVSATLCYAADALDSAQAKADPDGKTLWYDLRGLELEGQGWKDTKNPFDRWPVKAEGIIPKGVYGQGRHSAGMCVRFVTDAPAIQARWTLISEKLARPNVAAMAVSGLDLYIRSDAGKWQWAGVGRPEQVTNSVELLRGLTPGKHEFLLYLPLYNGVSSVELGIPKDSTLAKAPPRPIERQKPIVFYGTSSTQGASASRPGMSHVAIIGRRLDWPVINLGFSGMGKWEPEVARFVAELDPVVFALDGSNLTAEELAPRGAPFIRVLAAAHPKTPILLVETPSFPSPVALPERAERRNAKNAVLRKIYEQLVAEKVGNLHYLVGDKLLGDDGEATIDGGHPTDLGMVRYAEAYMPALVPLLPRAVK